MNIGEDSASAIKAALHARSLAVVGASSDPAKLNGMVMATLIGSGFTGSVYPVNTKGGEILGHKVYTSLSDIPGFIDAVIIVVPAGAVPTVIVEAAHKGARVAIILSAGFREFGRSDLECEILDLAERHGIRLMGPNIQGIACLSNSLCAMYMPVLRTRGPLTIISHSGSLTGTLLDWAEREGLGIEAAINLGNQVDLCESDYLDYFADDPATGVIACYIEGIRDGDRFLRSLRHAATRKPLTILKSGRTEAGARAAASHTGSLAGSHRVFTSICRQYGVVPADGLADLYDVAKGLALIRPPAGNRLAVISTSGGATGIVADGAYSTGLVIPPLPREAAAEVATLGLPPVTHIANPFDMPVLATSPFLEVARILDRHDVADTLLICFADPVPGVDSVFAESLHSLRMSVAVCYMGGGADEDAAVPVLHRARIPVFSTGERAVRGVSAAVWRASHLHTRQRAIEARHVA